jgi:hypothetical protein
VVIPNRRVQLVPNIGIIGGEQAFPPHDADVSGTRWLAVMQRLAAESPRVVVPGPAHRTRRSRRLAPLSPLLIALLDV